VGRAKKIILIDLQAMTDKVMLEVKQIEINKGDYVIITIPLGLEYLGKHLLNDINDALPGVFVTLTFEGVKAETKKIDDLKGDEND